MSINWKTKNVTDSHQINSRKNVDRETDDADRETGTCLNKYSNSILIENNTRELTY